MLFHPIWLLIFLGTILTNVYSNCIFQFHGDLIKRQFRTKDQCHRGFLTSIFLIQNIFWHVQCTILAFSTAFYLKKGI